MKKLSLTVAIATLVLGMLATVVHAATPGQSTKAKKKNHFKRTVIVFSHEDGLNKAISKLSAEQVAQGGTLVAQARMEMRVRNQLNEPIPEDLP
jgi:hypothetical protein